MPSSTAGKDEWLVALQLFLNVRLRTASFSAASRGRPQVCVPLPLPNTQHLIDGVMWSVRDNAAWAADAWLGVQSHLLSCSQRYAQLSERLLHANTHDAAVEHERLYSSHACVQDVYIAFCVVDAFLRHVGEAVPAVKEAAEKELPRLVAEHMPIWQLARSSYAHDAVEDYRLLFLDLLRAWAATRLLRPDTHRRVEEYVRHKLKTLRDGLASADSPTGGSNSNNHHTEHHTATISAGLRALMSGATTSSASALSSAAAVKGAAASTPDAVRMTIANFVSAIFPHPRSESGRQRCAHCGSVLKSVAAKNAHYRYHFYNRSYQTEEKIVRLAYPSLDDYAIHDVDSGETGNFVRTTENLLDVFRAPEKRSVRVRRPKQADKPS
ncbi:hypothetical protein DQ04_06161020 [Trypanosoma grayi]|uniref:hypothetical protein n=1 Tax=Trypanosoma grayi TaxID=71804 RepID=UPI0004F3F7D1|nr:hypothetical protein DQ04_06161020 [Trypanosoma grayi]KEG08926.1 hypothetical protein DQ04_06161020 [Trypanosoma grayi]